jgi:hypothetical protein
MIGDRDRCLAAGRDGYIAKPIRAHDLLSHREHDGFRVFLAAPIGRNLSPSIRADLSASTQTKETASGREKSMPDAV